MRAACSPKILLCLRAILLLALAPALMAQTPRRPRGIYAVVDTGGLINMQQQTNPSITTAQLDVYFNSLYEALLSNPAVAGLTLQVRWDTVNPNPPATASPYLWNIIDDAFNQAAAWDAQNPGQTPKTIQIIATPGFNSPAWLLAQIPPCDGLFQSPVQTPPSTCGTVTFKGYNEADDGNVLPLPWNAVYKSAWQTFLTAFAARYGSNPAFVSIAVAGPTAASAEITTVTNDDANNPQTQFSGGPIPPNNMWLQLFAFHYPGMAAYQGTDQAFIDEWDAAIDLYGEIFSGITLVATWGDKLPSFDTNNHPIPTGFSGSCSIPNMTCAAITTVMSYFVEPTVGGANAKASQTSSFIASRPAIGLGIESVKMLSLRTAQLPAPSAQILGGIQFNQAVVNSPVNEGCTVTFPPDSSDTPAGCTLPVTCTDVSCVPVACIPQACLATGVTTASLASYKTFNNVPAADLIPPEQGLYNLLNIYFTGTAAGASFGGTPGVAPLNYLQIYSEDIQYASANVNVPAQVVEAGGVTVSTTAQAMLNLTSQKLLTLGEPGLPAITPGGIVPATIQAGEWATIYGTNLAGGTATWTGNFPASLGGTSVTVGGKTAFLSFASPGQIDLQVPNVTGSGAVPVVVTTATGSATANATLASFAPSFFLLDSTHVAGIILRANGAYEILGPTGSSLGYPTVAARAGDSIALFGTGFGPTNPPVTPGVPYSGAAPTISPVTIRINNTSVTPTFAGLSGAGLYQLNLTVPPGLGTGDVYLQATVGGVQTVSGVVISLQ